VRRALFHFPGLCRLLVPAAASLALVLPVLLQERVQAVDLASHLYNTWLVLRVKSGEPLGLEIVPQYSNVLFDWWLEGLWRIGGPAFAEKAAVSLAVLAFFWGGVFSPVAPGRALRMAFGAASGHAGLWLGLSPGFLQLLSLVRLWVLGVGLAAAGGKQAPRGLPLLAVAAAAHLLGASVAAGFVAYLLLWRQTSGSKRRWILAAAVLALAGVAAGIAWRLPSNWHSERLLHLIGVTGFLIYGTKYTLPALIVAGYWIGVLPSHAQSKQSLDFSPPAAHLAFLCGAALLLLPTAIHWPGTRFPLNFIDWRLALWFTLLLHCWLATLSPARFTLAACSTAAAVYFLFLAADWRILGRFEQALHEAVRRAPPESRVVTNVTSFSAYMNPLLHLIDRSCIGHCYSYANYEPGTFQFRLRALPGSPVVIDSPTKLVALQEGTYELQPRDLPLFGVYLDQTAGSFRFQVRPLEPGEVVQRVRVNLPPEWF
jgi:hypothetical protein